MKKRLTKALAIFLSAIMLVTCMVFAGCVGFENPDDSGNNPPVQNPGGDDNGNTDDKPSTEIPPDTDPVNSSAMGYLEDFGCEVVTDSVLKEEYQGLSSVGHDDNHYYPTEVALTSRIYFSHLSAPAGTYTATFGEQDLGQVTVNSNGEITLDQLPQNIVLGEKYTLTCVNEAGKPYNQTVRFVSRTIDNSDEFLRAVTYYKRDYDVYMKQYSGQVYNTEKPVEVTNPGKYYDGETFSQRLYVMTTDITVTEDDCKYGPSDLFETDYWTRNPFCNMWHPEYNYFYDEFDGNGYSVTIGNVVGPVFGHIGQNAKIYDLHIGATTTYMNQFAGVAKCLFALSIGDYASIESVVVYPRMDRTLANFVGLAGRIYPNAVVKDIFIHIPSSIKIAETGDTYVDGNGTTQTHNKDNNMKSAGGFCCEIYYELDVDNGLISTPNVSNIVVLSTYIDHAGWANIPNSTDKVMIGGENSEYEYYLEGCYIFTYASEVINSGKNTIGNWNVVSGGNVKFNGEHD